MILRNSFYTYADNRILLVEDDPQAAQLLTGIIRTLNPKTQVEWATSSEGAKVLLEKGIRFAMILADQQLAGKETGVQLWEQYRSAGGRIPFVVLSGMAQHDFFNLFGPTRVAPSFLGKPIRAKEITQVLANYIPKPLPGI